MNQSIAFSVGIFNVSLCVGNYVISSNDSTKKTTADQSLKKAQVKKREKNGKPY
jgi:hypothetical protein